MIKIDELKEQGLLTEMESKVMDWLLTSGYYAEKYFSDVTQDDISATLEIPTRQLRGVITSLVNKKYLFLQFMDETGYTFVHATDKGYQLDDDYNEKWEPDNVFL